MQPSVKLQSLATLMNFFAVSSRLACVKNSKFFSAYHFDTIRTSDELHSALCRIEKQHMKPSTEKMKSAACKSAQEQDKEKSKEKTNWTRLDMKDWKP